MPFELRHNTIEHWEKPMPAQYWARNKKASINLNNDVPLAIERQFSDQQFLIEKNRNPRLYEPMKCDKPILEVRFGKKGVPTPLGMKAKALNRIVREVSEVKDYVITAPLKTKEDLKKLKDEPFDPDVHPLMKPYRKEANQKPKMMNFGHRPRSANRTFHPATMKIKLDHGEIARAGIDSNKSTFGLPVVVLSKVIQAPKLFHNSDVEGRLGSESKGHTPKTNKADLEDPLGLFDIPFDSNSPMDGHGARASAMDDNGIPNNTESWLDADMSQFDNESNSNIGSKSNISKSKTRSKSTIKSKSLKKENSRWKEGKDLSGRADWDTAHHQMREGPNDRFLLKRSGLLEQNRPIQERLTRFIKKAASTGPIDDSALGLEKVMTDRLIAKGGKPHVEQRDPHENPFYDEYVEFCFKDINYEAQVENEKRENRVQDYMYQRALETIPNVPYYPDTVASDIQAGNTQIVKSVAKRSERTKIKNMYDTGFKVASLSERVDTFFTNKRKEAGTKLNSKTKSEFDPGLAFTDAGFTARDIYGANANTNAIVDKVNNNLGPLDAASKAEMLSLTSPFALESIVPKKKKKPKKKLDPAEAKMREAIKRAAKGDQDALFDHFIGSEVLQGIVSETAVDMKPEPEIPEEFMKAQLEINLKNAAVTTTDNTNSNATDSKEEYLKIETSVPSMVAAPLPPPAALDVELEVKAEAKVEVIDSTPAPTPMPLVVEIEVEKETEVAVEQKEETEARKADEEKN